jgi:enoyl-CoA hydratase/carnithine racemase
MPNQDVVLRDHREGVCTLTLNRPEKLNSLTLGMFERLDTYVSALESRPEATGCVVLRGAGACFSAGHDLKDIQAGETAPIGYQSRIIERLANLPMPVVTAVQGHCYTGALELALAGDIIIAAESAKFADTHAKFGLTPIWGMSQRLPRRVGAARAREMMFTCRTFRGAQAAEIGLANVCVPDAEFEAAVTSLVEDIVANSWFSHRANKRLLVATDSLPLAEGLAHEVHRCEGLGPDAEDRLAAFGLKSSA